MAESACPIFIAPPLRWPRVANSCSAVRCWTCSATSSAGRPPRRLPRPRAVRPAVRRDGPSGRGGLAPASPRPERAWLPGGRRLEHGLSERLGAQVRDLLVLGVGDHAAERLAGGIADEQDGVPVLARLGDERCAAVPCVEDLAAVAGAESLG